MSKPVSKEQLRERFLSRMRIYAREWATYENKTAQQRCDGLAFSILAMLDGSDPEIPAFDLAARPHPDDEAYDKAQGEDWIVDGQVINEGVHLHGQYYDRNA